MQNGRKYLSWDIGIKNLAYCLLRVNTDKTYNFEIIKWGVINLCDEDNTCSNLNKQKTPCTAKAIYELDEKYYCEKHKILCEYKKFSINKIDNKTLKCVYNIKNKMGNKMCNKTASCYIDNVDTVYCASHGKIMQINTEKSNNLMKINRKNANKIVLEKLALRLYNELDNNIDFLEANEILIENQPSLTNPTMKSIMMLLYSYFVLKCLSPHNKNTDSKTEIIKLISPSNKIKVSSNAVNKLNDIDKSKDRDRYIMTKTLGIKFCMELIKDDVINRKIIESYKKKDDLSDAFLQGYHYVFCRNGIPENISIILNKITDKKEITIDI